MTPLTLTITYEAEYENTETASVLDLIFSLEIQRTAHEHPPSFDDPGSAASYEIVKAQLLYDDALVHRRDPDNVSIHALDITNDLDLYTHLSDTLDDTDSHLYRRTHTAFADHDAYADADRAYDEARDRQLHQEDPNR